MLVFKYSRRLGLLKVQLSVLVPASVCVWSVCTSLLCSEKQDKPQLVLWSFSMNQRIWVQIRSGWRLIGAAEPTCYWAAVPGEDDGRPMSPFELQNIHDLSRIKTAEGLASVSLQGLNVMESCSQSPTGFHLVDRPRQLELFVGGEAELLQQDGDVD